MRDLINPAIYRRIDRASEAPMPPTRKLPLGQINETRPLSSFAGRKRQHPSTPPSTESSDMDVVDLTDDAPPHTYTRETNPSVKRQRLPPSEVSARPPTSRSDSVAPLDMTQKNDTKREDPARTAPASTGLLTPEITPQKQREQYENLHFADSAYATSGEVASLVEARNKHSGDVVQRSTEMASDSVIDLVNKSEHPQSPDTPKSAALRRSDSSRHSLPAATGGDTSASQIPGSALSSTERMDAAPLEPVVTSAPETPDQIQSDARPLTENPQTSEDIPLSSRPLHQIPEIASRFIPKTSTAENIEYTNPQKFSLKPPYWKRWTPQHYARFAEHLQAQFDPLPFAREQNIPVDEVMHCFTSVVCQPLWDADTAVRKGEEGMVAQMEAVGKFGTPSRWWGREVRDGERVVGRRVFGELTGVERGVVVLATGEGSKCCLRLVDLGEEDVGFLKGMLSGRDRGMLWEGHAVGVPYSMGTGLRTWTMRGNGKKAFAEVVGVGEGVVVLLLENEKRPTIKVDQLVDGDAAYLRTVLSKKDMAVLWPSP
ncbi:hypothetical protein LTR35_001761 [Friedmanniomyces endolithicus]|uniref:Uncharacterized protein n=1 Tax=Friedmanniomyces endolithicus TaxID=329885 RepID=A0AAN6JDB5_9PEZI|nr:hypothetical protein LTR35_001761 [Friedmanniomyces endolithicus]KAK0296846.1 hypothetical protein LTS00_004646 [Friedmanniomyces endolithicus]KAK0325434.1 hypothetical protein LTR82_003717 [Friedmanniomyces endolithicus]KAK1011157.1 hypothetical protein LTR54_005075 [Friedmanniomyces endolithicus]